MVLPKHWEELTFAKTKTDIMSEFVKKYKNSYIWYYHYDYEPILCTLMGVDTSEDDYIFEFNSSKYETLTCRLDSQVVLKAQFPMTGLFNIGNTSMGYIYRLPSRQYKKAPNKENCYIYYPHVSFLHKFIVPQRNELNEHTLLAAYKEEYTSSYHEAFDSIKQCTAASRALTRWFGLSSHVDKKDLNTMLLWYLDKPIALIKNSKIDLQVPELKQEVKDLIKRNNYPLILL